MNEEIKYGGFNFETNHKDYILGGDSELSKEILLRQKENDIYFEYNQNFLNKSSCVIHSAAGALGDLLDKRWREYDLKEMLQIAIDRKEFKTGWGMYFYQGIDIVRNWWNKNNPDNKVLSFRTKLTSVDFKLALDFGYSVVTGFQGNDNYTNDSKDGFLDNTYFGKLDRGHCVRLRKINGKICVIDNYKGVKEHNIYQIMNLDGLIKNGVFYDEGYLFINENKMEKIFEDVDSNNPYYDVVKFMKDSGLVNGYEDGTFRPNQDITRGEMCIMLKRFHDKFLDTNKE